MVSGADTQVAETAVLGAFGMAGVVISAYIGFATAEDVKLYKPTRKAIDVEEED